MSHLFYRNRALDMVRTLPLFLNSVQLQKNNLKQLSEEQKRLTKYHSTESNYSSRMHEIAIQKKEASTLINLTQEKIAMIEKAMCLLGDDERETIRIITETRNADEFVFVMEEVFGIGRSRAYKMRQNAEKNLARAFFGAIV